METFLVLKVYYILVLNFNLLTINQLKSSKHCFDAKLQEQKKFPHLKSVNVEDYRLNPIFLL